MQFSTPFSTVKRIITNKKQLVDKDCAGKFRVRKIPISTCKVFVKSTGATAFEEKTDRKDKNLTRILRQAKRPTGLYELLKQNRDELNYISLGAAAMSAAHLCKFSSNQVNIIRHKMMVEIYEILLVGIETNLSTLNTQSVSNCLWSLARAYDTIELHKGSVRFYEIFTLLLMKAVQFRFKMKSQEISNVLWSLAKVQWQHLADIQQVMEAIGQLDPAQILPQDLSNNLWSMATLRYEDVKLTAHLLKASDKTLKFMYPQAISNSVWALKQLRYYDQDYMAKVEAKIKKEKRFFSQSDISNLSSAFVDFGLEDYEVMEIFTKMFLANNHVDPLSVSNYIYYLSALGCRVKLCQKCVDRLVQQELKHGVFDNKQKYSIFVKIQRAKLGYLARGEELVVPKEIEEDCKQAIQLETYKKLVFQNHFRHSSVAPVIKREFPAVKEQVIVCDGQLRIDMEIAIPGKDVKIAVEPRTLESYRVTNPRLLMGSTQACFEMLRGLGWQVVEVSELQWEDEGYQQSVVSQIRKFLDG